jgi:2-phospho-L-lactate guanylyltransferase
MSKSRAILIPVKEHARAKTRMAPLLNAEERSALAWALLEDLIAALRPLPWPVVAVTNSDRVACRVGSLGWTVHREEHQSSESASIDAASKRLSDEGVEAVLRVPADLPLIQSADIADLLSMQLPARSAVVVPSFDKRGTNALLRTPPDLFPSRFGPDSFALHLREAAAAGAHLQIIENPRLALDLDDAADVARFVAQPADGETYRTLMRFNIRERLAAYGA